MSEGIIKLQKVRVGSILRVNKRRKKLRVKFEDQKPKDLIKDLSKDIDNIGSAIDNRFSYSFYEGYGAFRSYAIENRVRTNNIQDPGRNEIETLKNECEHISSEKSKSISFIQINSGCTSESSFGIKNRKSYLPAVSAPNSENTNGKAFRLKKNIIAPYQTSEKDIIVVKKGRLRNSQLMKSNKTQLLVLKESSGKASPIVIKQTRPLKKFSHKSNKDILIAI